MPVKKHCYTVRQNHKSITHFKVHAPRSGLEKWFILILVQFLEIFFFLKFFEEEVSDYLSWPDSYVSYVWAHNYAQNFHQGDCMQSSSKVVDSKFSI